MLEIFGAVDPFKPKEFWQELREDFGDRVGSVVIDDASHALFPEQPHKVAEAMLPWLDQHFVAGTAHATGAR